MRNGSKIDLNLSGPTVMLTRVSEQSMSVQGHSADQLAMPSATASTARMEAAARRPALSDFSQLELMLPDLRSRDAAAVVGELCTALNRAGKIPDVLPFYQVVLGREGLCSTANAPGVALPHVRTSHLPSLCFALGRTREPMPWFAGNWPVHLVFLFAVPEQDAATYLTLMSGVARLTQDKLRWPQLLDAPDAKGMFEVLTEIHLRRPRSAAARS